MRSRHYPLHCFLTIFKKAFDTIIVSKAFLNIVRKQCSGFSSLKQPWKLEVQDLRGKKYLFIKHGLMVVDSGTWGQLWYHSLKRAERESKNKVSSTVNRYVFCFINARFVELFSVKFSPDRVSFPFSAHILFPSLFTVPLMRMTDLLSRLEFLN